MKKIILLGIMLLLVASFSLAAVDILTTPYSDTFTPEGELGLSLSSIKSAQNIQSCYEEDNWKTKDCDYLYYCYAILPSYADDIGDALTRDCYDVTDKTSVTLSINQFVPPKGVLYYVVTFATIVNYQANDANVWSPTTTIPETYINAHAIRSVCPDGQMLGMERDPQGVAIGPKCYIAERVCIDPLSTGLCTNPYSLYVLDRDENGEWEDNLGDATNYCKDANHDRICDFTIDLECVDVCKDYKLQDGDLVCEASGMNGLCDEWDMAAEWSCIDREISPNSNICDDVDVYGCLMNYDPVCVGGRGGTTYPNACFAEGQGYSSADYTLDACEPSVVQCYDPTDCPDTSVCLGGSTAGITKLCLGHMCSYSGACGNLACSQDSDCEGMDMPCVGVVPSCEDNVCVISGKCLTQPEPQRYSIWELIQQIWGTFWAWVKSLFV